MNKLLTAVFLSTRKLEENTIHAGGRTQIDINIILGYRVTRPKICV